MNSGMNEHLRLGAKAKYGRIGIRQHSVTRGDAYERLADQVESFKSIRGKCLGVNGSQSCL